MLLGAGLGDVWGPGRCCFQYQALHVITTVHITILLLLLIMSVPMTGEFRSKLWAHSARDWAINNPECGTLIMMSVIVLKIGKLKLWIKKKYCWSDNEEMTTKTGQMTIRPSSLILFCEEMQKKTQNVSRFCVKSNVGDLDDKEAQMAPDWSIKNPQWRVWN